MAMQMGADGEETYRGGAVCFYGNIYYVNRVNIWSSFWTLEL